MQLTMNTFESLVYVEALVLHYVCGCWTIADRPALLRRRCEMLMCCTEGIEVVVARENSKSVGETARVLECERADELNYVLYLRCICSGVWANGE
jgi:hypothetical protein